MPTYGHLSEFQPGKEGMAAYLVRVTLFFEANTVSADRDNI